MDDLLPESEHPNRPVYSSPQSPRFDIGEIFSDAFKLLREGFAQFAFIFLLIQAPLIVIQMLLLPPESSVTVDVEALSRLLTSTIFFAFLGLFATLNLLTAARHRIAGTPLAFYEVFLHSILKFPIALLAAWILGVVVFVGALAFIIPGIIFYVFACCFLQAIALRDQRIFGSLVYSYELVKGNWWLVFAYQLICFAITGIISLPLVLFSSALEFGFVVRLMIYLFIGAVEVVISLAGVMMFFNLESIKADRERGFRGV